MTIIHELRPRPFRFRWAACQIDILGRLYNVCIIRKVLHALPKTLDETYERILMKIPQKSSRLIKLLSTAFFSSFGKNIMRYQLRGERKKARYDLAV